MSGGIDFTLAGVPVRVLWMFFLVAFLLGSSYQDPTLMAVWVGVMFASILLHEFGHAFAYRAFGVQPAVVLHGFGGLTFGRSLPLRQDLLVSLAGPAAGLSIGLPLWWVQSNVVLTSPVAASAIAFGIWINILWGIVNLLPLMPLDGGQATNALLSIVFKRDMTRVTRVISVVTAVVGVGLALRYRLIFAALLAGWYGVMNIQELMKAGPAAWAPTVTTPPAASAAPSGVVSPGDPAQSHRGPESPVAGADSHDPSIPAVPRRGERTFAHEADAAARALASDEPELAAIAVDRAKRMAATDDERAVAGQLESELSRRLGG